MLFVVTQANLPLAAVYVSIREATEDTVLVVPNPIGQEGSKPIHIAKGTQVIVDWVGTGESRLKALKLRLNHWVYQNTIRAISKIPLSSSLPGGMTTQAKRQ